MRWFVIGGVVLVTGVLACVDQSLIQGEGTMGRGVGPECLQTWYIRANGGQQYWPVEDPAFHQEGLRVRFKVRKKADAVSICMAGTIVEIVSLQKL